MKQISRLHDAELEVMQALWAVPEYPARTSDLAARLDRDWKAPTLLKLLSRLEERGFVRGEKEGRSNGYTPLVNRPDYLAAESRSFLERVHGGSLSSLMAALYPEKELSREDIAELERILEKGGKGGAGATDGPAGGQPGGWGSHPGAADPGPSADAEGLTALAVLGLGRGGCQPDGLSHSRPRIGGPLSRSHSAGCPPDGGSWRL